jgi:general stress protein 26
MSEIDELRDAPAELVWKTIAAEGVAMIATPDVVAPMRPMSVHAAPEECAVWFITHAGSDFAAEVGEGGPSRLVTMARDGRIQLSLSGRIEPSHSALHIERYWTPLVGAWFERGRDDPAVLAMRFTPQTGKIWVAAGGLLAVGWEWAVASLTGGRPDLGTSAEVVFAATV